MDQIEAYPKMKEQSRINPAYQSSVQNDLVHSGFQIVRCFQNHPHVGHQDYFLVNYVVFFLVASPKHGGLLLDTFQGYELFRVVLFKSYCVALYTVLDIMRHYSLILI